MPSSKKELLKKSLRKPKSFSQIKQELGLTRKQAKNLMDELKAEGVHIDSYVDSNYIPFFNINLSPVAYDTLDLKLKDGNYVMGVTSDIHVGCIAFEEAKLNNFYDRLDNAGAKMALCAGDLITGVTVFRGQQAEIKIHTKMEQTQYFIDYVPSLANGGLSYMITGNHDLKDLVNSFDPGVIIDSKKPGWKYLGQLAADIKLASNLEARLVHLTGHPYALSYRGQKYMRDKLKKGRPFPDLLLLGHAHQLMYAEIQGVHTFECGTFQGETPFTKHHGLDNNIGAWIIEYDIENGKLKKLNPKLVTYD